MQERVSEATLEYVHFEALSSLVLAGKPHSSLSLPGEVEATIDFDRLVFKKARPRITDGREITETALAEGENRLAGGYILHVHTNFANGTPKNQSPQENIYTLFTQVTLSSDKIVGQLSCRPRRSGDKIKKGGISRDARQLMSEKKLPLDARKIHPVVCDGAGVLWIPDIALRDGAKSEKKENSITLSLFREKQNDL